MFLLARPVGGRLMLGNLFCVAVEFAMGLLFVWTVGDAGPYEVSSVLGRGVVGAAPYDKDV